MASAPLYRLPRPPRLPRQARPPRLPRQARLPRSARQFRFPVTLTATAFALAISSCASAPSGGPPGRATGTGSQVQAYVQPLPPPPPTAANSWGPTEVVLGFLHASASYAFDPAAPERYLVPSLRKSWRPANGPVAVVGGPTGLSEERYAHAFQGAPDSGSQREIVKFTGQRLATLTQTGQYQYTPGQIDAQFILAKENGVWLIDQLPGNQPGLMLTQSDFESVYQPRNLFFYAPNEPTQSFGVLVPDPVYAPLQSSNSALNTNLATGLVNGLLNGPGDWLAGATWSAFPAGSKLIKQVTITGRVAQVDLGGAAMHASWHQKQLMEAQLTATLGDHSYAEPLASQVQLYINNTLQYVEPTASINSLVTQVPTGPVLAITGPSSVGQLPDHPGANARVDPRVTPGQIGGATVTAVAAEPTQSPKPQIAVAVAYRAGCAVFLPAGGATYHSHVLSTSRGVCTSLSWDSNGNLWAAAGQSVWVLPPQNRHPVLADLGRLTAVSQPGSSILALQMAPDNVRVALLVHTRSGNKLLLTAVRFERTGVMFGMPVSIGAGGAQPIAISWSDPYHLAVLGQSGQAGDLIFAVPLAGGAGLQPGGVPKQLGAPPPNAQTLTTDGSELVVGTFDGNIHRIFASSPASPPWARVTTGSDPVYPG